MAKINLNVDSRAFFWCPGCQEAHAVTYEVPQKQWSFNGDVDRPTISPSILVQGGAYSRVCHSFVRDGMIEFLGDSTHHLSGKTVELPEWPFSD